MMLYVAAVLGLPLAAAAFYGWFFPALVAHLKEKGWLENYMQHLADEPIGSNVDRVSG